MIELTINEQNVQVEPGATVLEAAEKAGIHIPTLCYLAEVQAIGACRVCLVEIEGNKVLQAACTLPAAEGMKVVTHNDRVRKARRFSVEMLLSNHPFDCLSCARNLNCELQKIAEELGIRHIEFAGEKTQAKIDDSSPSLVRDPNKCILCRRCVTVCQEVQGVAALAMQGSSSAARIAMIAITTRSSIKLNPKRGEDCAARGSLLGQNGATYLWVCSRICG